MQARNLPSITLICQADLGPSIELDETDIVKET
jgi:hypothetical protein